MDSRTGEIPIQSFKDWQQLLNSTPNKVAVLVGAFKVLHPDATNEDIETAGGRLAGMIKQAGDAGLVLLKIWMTAPVNIVGSHLNYINGALKLSKPVGEFETPKYNPTKYQAQKYGAMIQR